MSIAKWTISCSSSGQIRYSYYIRFDLSLQPLPDELLLRDVPGYMEQIGSGTRFMLHQMRQMGLSDPQFQEASEFVVTLPFDPLSRESLVHKEHLLTFDWDAISMATSTNTIERMQRIRG